MSSDSTHNFGERSSSPPTIRQMQLAAQFASALQRNRALASESDNHPITAMAHSSATTHGHSEDMTSSYSASIALTGGKSSTASDDEGICSSSPPHSGMIIMCTLRGCRDFVCTDVNQLVQHNILTHDILTHE